ncbi:Fact complex subunit [Globisporangium polare]
MKESELRETIRAAFARYDEDANGSIDARELRRLIEDLGGVLTDSDLSAALRVLDKDRNGVIDLQEFIGWWTSQAADLDGDGAVTDLEKTLERLKEFGRECFHVDIHTAAWRGFADVVERLVQDDSELATERDSSDYGSMNTPLHYAAYQGHVQICTTLLEHGASANVTNASGCTPVFYAAQQSQEAVVSLLLQRGADIKIKESEHQLSPVDVCHADPILKLFESLAGCAPGSPSAPTLSEPGECRLKVTWLPPKLRLSQVAPLSLYKLRLSSTTAPVRSLLVPGSATEALVDELVPNSSYCCEIAAVNLHGMSDFSAKSEPLTTLRARPSPPQDLIVDDVGSNCVQLRWTVATDDDASQCIVQQSLGAKDGWKVVYKGEAHLVSCTVENLFGDQKYLFRVAAVNTTGCSEFSTPVIARTLSTGACKSELTAQKKVVQAKVVVDAFKQFASVAGESRSLTPRPKQLGNLGPDNVSESKEAKPLDEVPPNTSESLPAAKAKHFLQKLKKQHDEQDKQHPVGQESSEDEFVYQEADESSCSD